MEIKVESHHDSLHTNEEKLPLLKGVAMPNEDEQNLIQKAISQTFKSTAHLANLYLLEQFLLSSFYCPYFQIREIATRSVGP